MIIPKEYGGLGFSALAHSAVLQKMAGMSTTLVSTVAVPNSLGPGELLVHYGTKEQKDHYLPRLADGREVPCFALTGPYAGSDATSIPDYGIVCKGEWNGANVVGVRLTFDKRYITLAPVATIVGLAFRMYDPEKMLGDVEDLGITLALLPRDTKGLEIGRRHFPLNVPFQNGPVRGKDVFVPLSQLIGGPDMAGQGWRMLVECLSVGRAISLPSNTAGGARSAVFATGAYARIRKQFGMPIGRFEGIEEALARIGGYTYAITALSRAQPRPPSIAARNRQCRRRLRNITRPSCARNRQDAMDVHGGKGVILGPSNWIGRGWQGAPIAITVEGANIMTRSLMIFGQGAIRCHPYVLKEIAVGAHRRLSSASQGVRRGPVRPYGYSRFQMPCAASCWASHSRASAAHRATRIRAVSIASSRVTAAALALVADTSMLDARRQAQVQGETLRAPGRCAVQPLHRQRHAEALRRHRPPCADQPLLAWAFHDSVWRMQMALDGVLRNFPVRPGAWLCA